MKTRHDPAASQAAIPFTQLWWLPSLFPLLLILMSFLIGVWSWGLMDDLNMVSRPGTIWERFVNLQQDLYGGGGRMYPVFLMHASFFYKVFADSPQAFFLFRWVEVILALGLWGWLAAAVTGKKHAAAVFFAVALSFYKFYDAFFYLSTQEILGILFSGAALLCFFYGLQPVWNRTGALRASHMAAGGLFLALAFLSKEPFVAVGVALGASLIALWFTDRGLRSVFITGLVIAGISVSYALILKFVVSQGYSSSYSLTDGSKILTNLQIWSRRVLFNHTPWIILGAGVLLFCRSNQRMTPSSRWAALFGGIVYLGFGIMILPWSGWGHYVLPLGIFFAFLVTVLIAHRLDKLRPSATIFLISASLLVNLLIGGSAIRFHATYQYDTSHLMQWLAENALFQHEVLAKGAVVRCNAQEPCETIPKLTNKLYDQSLGRFLFTAQVSQILKDPQTKYYVWSSQWGDQDLRRLGSMWTPMFVSEHWTVFRRMY